MKRTSEFPESRNGDYMRSYEMSIRGQHPNSEAVLCFFALPLLLMYFKNEVFILCVKNDITSNRNMLNLPWPIFRLYLHIFQYAAFMP